METVGTNLNFPTILTLIMPNEVVFVRTGSFLIFNIGDAGGQNASSTITLDMRRVAAMSKTIMRL